MLQIVKSKYCHMPVRQNSSVDVMKWWQSLFCVVYLMCTVCHMCHMCCLFCCYGSTVYTWHDTRAWTGDNRLFFIEQGSLCCASYPSAMIDGVCWKVYTYWWFVLLWRMPHCASTPAHKHIAADHSTLSNTGLALVPAGINA